MANIEVEAGRIPVSRGPWSSGVTVYKFNRFTYLGSEYEATADGLTNAPGSIVNNYPVANTGWRLTSVGMGEGIIESKADKDTDAVAGNVAEYDNSGNPVDSGFGMSDIAKKNSTVPSMTSGYSHGVVNPDTPGDDVELVSRAFPGVNGIADVKGFEGKTLAWNQLMYNGNFTNSDGWSGGGSVSGNVYTVSWNAQYSNNGIYQSISPIKTVIGHRYLVKILLHNLATSDITYFVGIPYSIYDKINKTYSANEKAIMQGIYTAAIVSSDTGEGSTFKLFSSVGTSPSVEIANYCVFDLTLMFGSGNEPATVEEFEAMFPNSYYPYNAGELISNSADGIETVGFNQWDEETLLGYYTASGVYYSSNDQLCTKNYIPVISGETYYFGTNSTYQTRGNICYYDANKNFIRRDDSSATFTVPSGASYIMMSFGTLYGPTYNHDICINLSSYSNGEYEPYKKSTLELNLNSIRVKDSDGNILTLEGGLKSAGSVKDEIVGNKYIKRIGEVDLGSLTYNAYDASLGQFRGLASGLPANATYGTGNQLCAKYIAVNNYNTWMATDKSIALLQISGDYVFINDSSLINKTTSEVNTAMSGVMLNYELATPVVYEIIDQLPCNYRTYEGGTEARVSDHLCTPLAATISYQKDFVASTNLEIMDLKNHGIAEGIADSISAGVAQEFTFRQSGGDGVNYMKRIKGKTLAWNQLVNYANISGMGQTTITLITNGVRATTTAQYAQLSIEVTNIVPSHKYLLRFFGSTTEELTGSQIVLLNESQQVLERFNYTPVTGENSKILTTSVSAYYLQVQTRSNNGSSSSGYTIDFTNIVLIDLTLMLGSGNEPATVAEFEAMFPLPYYDYNAGALISNDASGIETVGFNQWDEQWELGLLDTSGAEVANTTHIRAKNMIRVFPNTEYFCRITSPYSLRICQYDKEGSFINDAVGILVNESFVTRGDAAFIRFCVYSDSYGTTYNNDICINLSDPDKNGTYEPYWKRKIDLNLDSFKVKDKAGNIITVNGLKSAGSVYDEIVGNKYIKRIGEVDMGDLTYTVNSSVFRSVLSNIKKSASVNSVANLLCVRYRATTPMLLNNTDMSIASDESENKVGIKDTNYTDAASFKTAMSGVMLYYELATPVEYELISPIQNAILVDSGGVEKAVYPIHSDGSPSAPFNCDSNYSISIPKLIAKLNE